MPDSVVPQGGVAQHDDVAGISHVIDDDAHALKYSKRPPPADNSSASYGARAGAEPRNSPVRRSRTISKPIVNAVEPAFIGHGRTIGPNSLLNRSYGAAALCGNAVSVPVGRREETSPPERELREGKGHQILAIAYVKKRGYPHQNCDQICRRGLPWRCSGRHSTRRRSSCTMRCARVLHLAVRGDVLNITLRRILIDVEGAALGGEKQAPPLDIICSTPCSPTR